MTVVPDVPDDEAGLAGEPRWYTIVEKVPRVGGLESTTSFRCQWIDVAEGVNMTVFAGVATCLYDAPARYIRRRRGGGVFGPCHC